MEILETIPSDVERWLAANDDPKYARDIQHKISRLIQRSREERITQAA